MEVLYLKPGRKHITDANQILQTGADMSEAGKDKVMDTLRCKRRWRKNPTQLPALCQALKITGESLDKLLAARR